MRIAAAHGVVLGLLVAAWTLVMGVTGWYRDPVLQAAFFLDDLRASHRALLVSQGIAPEAIEVQVEAAAAGQTSLSSALTGAIATIVTGVIVASIAAMFLRPRTAPST